MKNYSIFNMERPEPAHLLHCLHTHSHMRVAPLQGLGPVGAVWKHSGLGVWRGPGAAERQWQRRAEPPGTLVQLWG